MKTFEAFCGTKSFSKVMELHGHRTFTLDYDLRFDPDIQADILAVKSAHLPRGVEIFWASPPCECFSVASIGSNWTGGWRKYIPKNERAKNAKRMVKKTLRIIEKTKPTWWFIENPMGVLRKMPFMEKLVAGGALGELPLRIVSMATHV